MGAIKQNSSRRPDISRRKIVHCSLHHLIGARVRIQAVKEIGSARLLHGLTGTVIGLHPIAEDWVKVQLDANGVTPHRVWSVPLDRLVMVEEERAA